MGGDESGNEDAPAGHISRTCLKVTEHMNTYGGQNNFVRFKAPGGNADRFQVTVLASGGSEEECLRIARLCYVKFEEGKSRQEVESFRKEMYEKVKARAKSATPAKRKDTSKDNISDVSAKHAAAGKEHGNQSKDGKESAACEKNQAIEVVQTNNEANKDKSEDGACRKSIKLSKTSQTIKNNESIQPADAKSQQGDAVVNPISKEKLDAVFEDAPEGHEAWNRVHRREQTMSWSFKVSAFQFQTTEPALGGSQLAAGRIARLLYVKAMEGMSKDEIKQYRSQLYSQVKEAFPNLPAPGDVTGDKWKNIYWEKKAREAMEVDAELNDQESNKKTTKKKKKKKEKKEKAESPVKSSLANKAHVTSGNNKSDHSVSTSSESEASESDSGSSGGSPRSEPKPVPKLSALKGMVAFKMLVRCGYRCPKTYELL